MKDLTTFLQTVKDRIDKANSVNDWHYTETVTTLLRLVETMSEALESIDVHFGTDYCSGDTMIAREALLKCEGIVK